MANISQNVNIEMLEKLPDGTYKRKYPKTRSDTGVTFDEHLADYATHGDISNRYRTGKDSEGVFTTIEWKREGGTLAKKSVLSGGTSPQYATRTVYYYALDGITITQTVIYDQYYDNDGDWTHEVIQ